MKRKIFNTGLMAIMIACLVLFSCSLKEKDGLNGEPLSEAEVMPVFPGGDEALLKFIAENVTYPESARMNGTHGRVVVKFCVTEKGKVDRVSVVQSLSPDLDAESIRVVKSMPAFTPGIQDGKPAAVWYMVPITFALK